MLFFHGRIVKKELIGREAVAIPPIVSKSPPVLGKHTKRKVTNKEFAVTVNPIFST